MLSMKNDKIRFENVHGRNLRNGKKDNKKNCDQDHEFFFVGEKNKNQQQNQNQFQSIDQIQTTELLFYRIVN